MIFLDKDGNEYGRCDPPKEPYTLIKPPKEIQVVIGQWADYYAEHDGMVETGPGCSERLQARIDAAGEKWQIAPLP